MEGKGGEGTYFYAEEGKLLPSAEGGMDAPDRSYGVFNPPV